jgi:hypothetical protein
VQVLRTSQLYETAAAYVEEQPAFLNAALLCRTDLTPLQLLYSLKQIEKDAGRNLQVGARGAGGAATLPATVWHRHRWACTVHHNAEQFA